MCGIKKGDVSGSAPWILIICFRNCQCYRRAVLDVVPTLPTMQQPLSGITGGSLSDYMQLRLEKALYFSTEAVVLPETCSHF